MLSSGDISTMFDNAINFIDVNIDTALQMFHEGIRGAAHCMQKTVVVGGNRHSPWFDCECREKRRLDRQSLRKYSKSNNVDEAPDLRADYTKERKQHKHLLREKKYEHKKTDPSNA